MIDPHAVLLAFLSGDAPLVVLAGTRMYAALSEPPEGYKPSTGSALVFRVRGGDQDESGHMQSVSFQFKCYGGGANVYAQTLAGSVLAKTLHEALNFRQSGAVMGAQAETQAQPLAEPDTGWPYQLVFYRVQMRSV